jgi:hypothetical protein
MVSCIRCPSACNFQMVESHYLSFSLSSSSNVTCIQTKHAMFVFYNIDYMSQSQPPMKLGGTMCLSPFKQLFPKRFLLDASNELMISYFTNRRDNKLTATLLPTTHVLGRFTLWPKVERPSSSTNQIVRNQEFGLSTLHTIYGQSSKAVAI